MPNGEVSSSSGAKFTYENKDIAKERTNCPFDKEEITNLIDGGSVRTFQRRNQCKLSTHIDKVVYSQVINYHTVY